MAATLTRQTDGSVLVLDGLTEVTYDQRYLVARHPGQSVATLTDHVQELAAPLSLVWVCSESPTVAGITTGPERYEEVEGWLRASVGVLLTYGDDRMTRRDLLLSGHPVRYARPRSMEYRLELVTASIARSRTVSAGVEPEQARADVRASRSATKDDGRVATTRAPRSLLSAALDLVSGGSGG